MRIKTKIFFIVFILIAVLVISGCKKTVYVCANGKPAEKLTDCPFNKISKIKQRDAEKFGTNYVSAYVQAQGSKSKLVSSYNDKGDFIATYIVTPKNDKAYETVVLIDGITGKVNCTEGCDYTGR